MFVKRSSILLALLLISPVGAVTIPVDQDVMTSAFFQGDNQVRGYADETPLRGSHRVASDLAFGSGPETVYMTFDFDFPGSFSQPIQSATLTVESVPGGFDADASPENPFQMSVHGVSADPLATITDDTNPSGTVSWIDFFDNNILDAASEATTVVTGFGTLEFDVTSLVNSWIDGSNSIHTLALTGKTDTLSDGNVLHGIVNNSSTAEVSHFLTVVVPEPASIMLMGLGLAGFISLYGLRRKGSRLLKS